MECDFICEWSLQIAAHRFREIKSSFLADFYDFGLQCKGGMGGGKTLAVDISLDGCVQIPALNIIVIRWTQ